MAVGRWWEWPWKKGGCGCRKKVEVAVGKKVAGAIKMVKMAVEREVGAN